MDRLVFAKLKTMGVVTSYKKVSRALELRSIEGTKIKTTKISSEGLRGNSTEICTHENIPLNGIMTFTDKIWEGNTPPPETQVYTKINMPTSNGTLVIALYLTCLVRATADIPHLNEV